MKKSTLDALISDTSDMFVSKERDNGEKFVHLKDDAPEGLRDSVRAAHGDKLPDDWTYGTYADILVDLTGYSIDSVDKLQDILPEVVDSSVDIYTAGLTKWLAEDVRNVYYITEVLEEGGCDDGWKLLAQAQYKAIDEIAQQVAAYLTETYESEV